MAITEVYQLESKPGGSGFPSWLQIRVPECLCIDLQLFFNFVIYFPEAQVDLLRMAKNFILRIDHVNTGAEVQILVISALLRF